MNTNSSYCVERQDKREGGREGGGDLPTNLFHYPLGYLIRSCINKEKVPSLDISRHGHESLLNVSRIFGTGLHEWDANFISKSLF